MADIRKRYAVLGAGFIGSALIRALLSENHEVSVLDRKSCPAEFNGLLRWYQGEFGESEKLNEVLSGVYCAYNLISSSTPLGGVNNWVENRDVENNILFLDVCVKRAVKKVVFASSASVYGLQPLSPILEAALTNPISQHGIIKLTIEKYHLLTSHVHGLQVCILRIGNPYGPGQKQGFIANLADCIRKNKPILLANHGRVVRDFIYIDDLVEGMLRVGITSEAIPVLLNFSSGIGHTLLEVVQIAGTVLGRVAPHKLTVLGTNDISYSVLNISRAKAANLLTLTNDINDGLRKVFNSSMAEK